MKRLRDDDTFFIVKKQKLIDDKINNLANKLNNNLANKLNIAKNVPLVDYNIMNKIDEFIDKIYVCYRHNHDKEICGIYECTGITKLKESIHDLMEVDNK